MALEPLRDSTETVNWESLLKASRMNGPRLPLALHIHQVLLSAGEEGG